MPAWDTDRPFHAVALVAGVMRQEGFSVCAHDVNIDFYRRVDDDEKAMWSEAHNQYWFEPDLPKSLWRKYRRWFADRLDAVLADKPALIAFSVNMSTRYLSIYAARYLKKRRPRTPILFGGVDCFPGEARAESFLDAGRRPYCDVVCQGECEVALPKFLAEFARTGSVRTQVPGFAYRDRRELVDTGDTELPMLDEPLPTPAYDLFDLSKYTQPGSLPFFLTRGCVYRCNFCSERPNFRCFRARRAEEAFAELQAVLPHAQAHAKVPTLSLADSNLNANPKVLREFVDLLLAHGVRIKWGGQAHFQKILTRDFLERMAQAGFVSVFWGLETGSQHVVDLMNKRYDQAEARRILRDCEELGIRQVLPIIIGYPGETPADLVETLDLIFEFSGRPLFKIGLPNLLVVRPNSPLHDDWQSHGLANTRYYDWSTADGTNDLHVRLARRFVARQAHSNPELSLDALADTGEMPQVKLNNEPAAGDLFEICRLLFDRAGCVEEFARRLREWSGRDRNQPPKDLWKRLDKDGSSGRGKTYELVLAALRRYRQVVAERIAVRRGSAPSAAADAPAT
ncbi:MAG: radical SAM protein [Phycisphaerae bacterium]|nr:radical SAM protein [Phycisphaerae bacterium]